MRRFLSTMLGQILAIIATSSAITFLLFIALLVYPGRPPTPPWPWSTAYRIISFVDILRSVPESQRAILITSVQKPDFSVRLTDVAGACPKLSLDTRDLEGALRNGLRDAQRVTVRACDSGISAGNIQVLIPLGGQTLDIRTDKVGRTPPRIAGPFQTALLFMCIAVAAMSAWAVWRVIRPLRRLSEKADAFGRDISVSPIEEEGPMEIRRVARTFNLMQQRITSSIQDRTRTLAAISHDLRTPLTRMRLQLDTGSADIARAKLLKDIDLMQSMVVSVLAFLSGSFNQEKSEWLDLGALLSTLCDEYEERGATVRYEGPGQICFFCRPNAINRALTNLIENGLQFSEHVFITASTENGVLTIDIADDGPGIPSARLQDVVEPFVRLDPSRSNRPGSVGLGLSIVKEIVESHGGTLELIDRQPTGLIARLRFPMGRKTDVNP